VDPASGVADAGPGGPGLSPRWSAQLGQYTLTAVSAKDCTRSGRRVIWSRIVRTAFSMRVGDPVVRIVHAT
jgi:hypothetical protein